MREKAYIVLCAAFLMLVLTGCAPGTVVQVGSTPVPEGQAAPSDIEVPAITIRVYAPGPNPLLGTADYHGRPASFWLGLWHGIISPLTLIATIVSRVNVQMYEVHNDGMLYNLGFFLGVLVMPAVFGILLGRR